MIEKNSRRRRRGLVLVAILALAGVEAGAGISRASNLESGSWILAFVIWQWVGYSLLAWAAAGLRGRKAGSLSILTETFLAVIAMIWLLGWAVRLYTGHFLDIATLRFVVENPRMIWLHLVEMETAVTLLTLGLIVALSGALLLLLRAIPGSWLAQEKSLAKRFGVVWILLGMLVVGVPAIDLLDRGTRVDKWQTSSLASLLVSGLDLILTHPPNTDCLAPKELIPIDRARPASPPRASVVLVAIESLRSDVLFSVVDDLEIMPNLSRLARENVFFTRAYSTSTHSDYADPAALASLYPLWSHRHHYYSSEDSWPRILPWDLIPDRWSSAVISAQNEEWGGMASFLRTGSLDLFFDARTGANSGLPTLVSGEDEGFARKIGEGRLRAGKLDDRYVMDTALSWLDSLEGDTPFLLALNLQSSHFPYRLGPDAPRPFDSGPLPAGISFSGYAPHHIDAVKTAYHDALRYADTQLGRLLEALDLGRTVVAVYGENGELFGEHGLFTHAKAPFEPVLQVPLVIANTKLHQETIEYPTSLIDVVPTVFGLAGGSGPVPGHQGIDVLGPQRPPSSERLVFFHNEVVWSRVDGVILGGRWKYWHDRTTDRSFLFDLREDPGETHNLADSGLPLVENLARLTRDWRCRQLAYYGNPLLYERYYPPSPPTRFSSSRRP